MLRVVSGYRIGFRWGVPHSSAARFLDESSAKEAIRKQSEIDDIPIDKYIPMTCFLLELQAEKGASLFFDLGSPVSVHLANIETTTPPPRSESVPAASKT